MEGFFRNVLEKMVYCAFLQVMLLPCAPADTIYFKDGSITVCREKALKEGETVKCEFYGTFVSYPLAEVDRIVAGKRDFGEVPEALEQAGSGLKTVKGAPDTPRAPLSPASHGGTGDGPLFYDPRRPHKYWASETSRHDSFDAAINELAKTFDRSPEWVKAHMGATNDLETIHKNLSSEPQTATVPHGEQPTEEKPEIKGLKGLKFYDPRRPDKYWTSKTSRHTSLDSAVAVMARQYGRSPEWIRSHMGATNDLESIHRNLSRALKGENGE
jgi:hypothetical protein